VCVGSVMYDSARHDGDTDRRDAEDGKNRDRNAERPARPPDADSIGDASYDASVDRVKHSELRLRSPPLGNEPEARGYALVA
jgi:hypothetical protein